MDNESVEVSYAPALDGTPRRKEIAISSMTEMIVEISYPGGRGRILHWFPRHDSGWSLHFHDTFSGAGEVMAELLGFETFDTEALHEVEGGNMGTSPLCLEAARGLRPVPK